MKTGSFTVWNCDVFPFSSDKKEQQNSVLFLDNVSAFIFVFDS